jgi:predicted RNA-binding protein associated with RNAse of E/G family
MTTNTTHRKPGDVVALRYITTDSRIEICWPCRIVEDTDELLALFIAAGSIYKAEPKRSAAEKRLGLRTRLPPHEYVWRNDTLRLMSPAKHHSVSLFWSSDGQSRSLLKYFVNMEEPFRRTDIGFDTQDHTLDIVVTPELNWHWRDEDELRNHVKEGFYTPELAEAIRAEGVQAIDAVTSGVHPCVRGWANWSPDLQWTIPTIPVGWDTTPATLWGRRRWAYSDCDD